MTRDKELDGIISQLSTTLETNYLVTRHTVTDNTFKHGRPQIRVKISLSDLMNSVSDLTNLARDIRKKTPNTYSVKLEIKAVF